jgi:chromosomal replication initiator protein
MSGRITMAAIREAVARWYQIRVADLIGPSRRREHVRPRQMAFWLTRFLTGRSYPEIGRFYGGRDHTTVLHGVRVMDGLLKRDPDLDADGSAIFGMVTA